MNTRAVGKRSYSTERMEEPWADTSSVQELPREAMELLKDTFKNCEKGN